MALEITLSGDDAMPYIDIPSISISDEFGSRGDSCRAIFHITSDKLSEFPKPKPGEVLSIKFDDEILFEGPIQSTTDRWFGTGAVEVEANCVDYTLFLDQHLVAKADMPGGPAGERIKALLKEFAPDFYEAGVEYIETGLIVPKESYDYVTLSSIIDGLCQATGYNWYVDFQKRVHFFAEEDFPAPIPELNIDTELQVGDIEVTEDISGVHNVIYVKDFVYRSEEYYEHRDRATSEGQTFYKLPYEPFSLEDTEVYTSADGETWYRRVVELDPLDGSQETLRGLPDRAYLCLVNWGVRFPTAEPPPGFEGEPGGEYGPPKHVKVRYRYVREPIVVTFMDRDSINEMALRTGTDGRFEVMISLPDYRVETLDVIKFYGELMLARDAWPKVSGSFRTFMSGWRAGQYFTIKSTLRDIYDIKRWAKSGHTVKAPVPVYVESVRRSFVMIDGEWCPISEISFSNRPFRL